MRRYVVFLIPVLFFLLCSPTVAFAQKAAVSVNLGDALCLGTFNVGFDYAVGRKWTLGAEARVNPWTFNKGDADNQFQLRHQTYSFGARFWPWYVYSGFWFGFRGQYQEYNRGGLFGMDTEEGDAFGVGLETGYNLILNDVWNINFGIGGWAGTTRYVTYSCPFCGRRNGEGTKFFVLPNEFIIALIYVF